MQTRDIEIYLMALDQALADQGLQTAVPVLLLGGAYILVQKINPRRATQDIDVFPFIQGEKDSATGMSLAVALTQAAQAVAQRFSLQAYWLNTIRIGALQPLGVAPQRTLWKKYQLLEVYIPDPAYVLVQKLCIARPKDQQDIIALFKFLKITTKTQAQALIDRYISTQAQQQQNIAMTLRTYFP